MMTILSADLMPGISKQVVKKIIKKYAKANITDDAAAAIASLLDKKAREIASFAVKNAKKDKREKIMKSDISAYDLKVGLNES